MRCPGLRFQKIEKHLATFRAPEKFSAKLLREWAAENRLTRIAWEIPGATDRPGLPAWAKNNLVEAANRIACGFGFNHSLIDHYRTFRNEDGSKYVVVLQPYIDRPGDRAALERFANAWTICPVRLNYDKAWWYPGSTVLVELWLHGKPEEHTLGGVTHV